jgi:phenylalanyl-tRNA synthetase beta chain
MKVSIAWIFDHIAADWQHIDISALVSRFNQITAEIEGFEKITIDLTSITLGRVTHIDNEHIKVMSDEFKKEFTLPARKGVQFNQLFLIYNKKDKASWLTGADLGSSKDFLMPAVYCEQSQMAGDWKKNIQAADYIIEIDNKSITHRPDLWGHRGLAREIAAILDLPLKPLDEFLSRKKIAAYDHTVPASKSEPFTITVENQDVIKRFAGIYLDGVEQRASLLWMAFMLARVDSKPIDALVDMTNYVMLDLSQPMHAFDANAIQDKKLIARLSKRGEKLTLLDDQTIELSSHDIIISDEQKPLGLAGIMGGKDSGISSGTKAVLLESACFDATTIRLTATRYKKRSEASARFEKSLDPNQNVFAIQRFLKLLNDANIKAVQSDEIFSIGKPAQEQKIIISHDFIEKRLGVKIAPDAIEKILKKLDFGLRADDGVYTITVPTFRGTKDVKIKEDILEEISRFYGYGNLHPQLPSLQVHPKNLDWLYRTAKIKELCAYSMRMRELYNYAFFDEEFLTQLDWQPGQTLSVQNPVSENARRLVTTLIPGLLKAVVNNSAENDRLRFFEIARVWHHTPAVVEKKSIAGIFYDKKSSIDFYDAKFELQQLFDALHIELEWHKITQPDWPWFAPYQTAHLVHNGKIVGIAGKLHPTFLNRLCLGDAFMFELDGDFFIHHRDQVHRYEPASKYPDMARDISMLIARETTAQIIAELIKQCDSKIIKVELLDFFEKSEWPDKRSMTFRFIISDSQKTMTKEDADAIWETVADTLKQRGANIR